MSHSFPMNGHALITFHSQNCVGKLIRKRFTGLEQRVILSTLFRHITREELQLYTGLVLRRLRTQYEMKFFEEIDEMRIILM